MKKRIICLIGCICILLFSGCLPIGVAPQQTQPPTEENTTLETLTEEQQPPSESNGENTEDPLLDKISENSQNNWRLCLMDMYVGIFNRDIYHVPDDYFLYPSPTSNQYRFAYHMFYAETDSYVIYYFMPIDWLAQYYGTPERIDLSRQLPFDASVGICVIIFHGERAEDKIQANAEKWIDGKYYDSEKNEWYLAIGDRWVRMIFPPNMVVSAEEINEYFTFEVFRIPQTTKTQVEKVEKDMTYSQVAALLGKDGAYFTSGADAYTWQIETGQFVIVYFGHGYVMHVRFFD